MDVDLNEGVLFIRKNKSHKERIVPMSDDMLDLCRSYAEQLALFAPKSDYIFSFAGWESISCQVVNPAVSGNLGFRQAYTVLCECTCI
ncbi:hypothetical protein DSOL_5438 [Desulfosporosinus metallidurans]|uniref:Tyr recombinase domain-containing protein n=1 Tax=Desulfosporosinus metallidurans TaxID=1888891 RepID=A0A1Q8QAN4_9FIRM|nr:hypothetical protein DSOL_5438 [Desulfosporosinus metallidurans]